MCQSIIPEICFFLFSCNDKLDTTEKATTKWADTACWLGEFSKKQSSWTGASQILVKYWSYWVHEEHHGSSSPPYSFVILELSFSTHLLLLLTFPTFVRYQTFVKRSAFLLHWTIIIFFFHFGKKNYFSFEFDPGGTLSLNTTCLAAELKINYLHSSNGVSKLISVEQDCISSLECPKVIIINDKWQ